MPRCPNCDGALLREPAAARCLACGCRWEVRDATDEAKVAQRVLDVCRRPRSIECWPDNQDIAPRPRLFGRGWVRLPDPSQGKRARARDRL